MGGGGGAGRGGGRLRKDVVTDFVGSFQSVLLMLRIFFNLGKYLSKYYEIFSNSRCD